MTFVHTEKAFVVEKDYDAKHHNNESDSRKSNRYVVETKGFQHTHENTATTPACASYDWKYNGDSSHWIAFLLVSA